MTGRGAAIRKAGGVVRDAWLVLGVTVLLFCAIEGGFTLAFLAWDRLHPAGSSDDPRSAADTYRDRSWVAGLYDELKRSRDAEWKPYVYWRRKPFRGEQITVDLEGIRRTVSPEPAADRSPVPLKVFMFGGSTLWGTGARDAYTIPSVLARELRERGIEAEVTNFGESGYVSTQEVITLLLQLRAGRVPDLVVFYDGVNDTYSAFQQQRAGLPQNEQHRVKEFNLSKADRWKQRAAMLLRDLGERSSTVRAARALLGKPGAWRVARAGRRPPENAARASEEELARDVVAAYRGNVELVRALAEGYRFKSLFYLQPTVFQKERLTGYERDVRRREPDVERFFRTTYEIVRQDGIAAVGGSDFRDLSLAFVDEGAPLYVDWCHLGESGNEWIAKLMSRDILAALAAGPAAAADSGPAPGGR